MTIIEAIKWVLGTKGIAIRVLGEQGKWHLFQGNKAQIFRGTKTMLGNREDRKHIIDFGKQGNKPIYFKGTSCSIIYNILRFYVFQIKLYSLLLTSIYAKMFENKIVLSLVYSFIIYYCHKVKHIFMIPIFEVMKNNLSFRFYSTLYTCIMATKFR